MGEKKEADRSKVRVDVDKKQENKKVHKEDRTKNLMEGTKERQKE